MYDGSQDHRRYIHLHNEHEDACNLLFSIVGQVSRELYARNAAETLPKGKDVLLVQRAFESTVDHQGVLNRGDPRAAVQLTEPGHEEKDAADPMCREDSSHGNFFGLLHVDAPGQLVTCCCTGVVEPSSAN